MYVHSYIHTHTYVHTRTYIHTYIHTYVRIYVDAYIHTYIHTYIYTYVHTYVCTYIYIYTYIYIPTNVHTYAHTYILTHTHIHTYIHTYVHTLKHTWGTTGTSKNKEIIYNKIPKSQIVQQVKQQSIEKWQTQWEQTTKGSITKQFFPNIKERLQKRIKLTLNFTAIVTAHGKTKPYLHKFKIIDSPDCPCETGNQTVECKKLQKEREKHS